MSFRNARYVVEWWIERMGMGLIVYTDSVYHRHGQVIAMSDHRSGMYVQQ